MKRGFTLIELLAVIVILAIIALIATPIILNIVEDSKKSAAAESAKLYTSGLQTKIATMNLENEFNPSVCTIANGAVSCDGQAFSYEISGQAPTSGTINFTNGVLSSYSLCVSGFRVEKSGNNVTTTKDATCSNVEPVYSTPGLYRNGVMVYTWQELIDEGLIEVYEDTYYTNEGDKTGDIVYAVAPLNGYLYIDDSIEGIGYHAFGGDGFSAGLTGVTIPDSVEFIEESAFKYNFLTSVTIPDSVMYISDYAFAYNSLMGVNIPNSVEYIGGAAFQGNSITSINIPSSVTTIEESAFADNQLTSVTIPSSVESIGNYAFNNNQLTSVTIPNNVENIGRFAFANNKLTSINIPSSVTTIGDYAFSYNPFVNITVDPNNTAYDSRNNSNAIIKKSNNALIQGSKNTVIPNTVEEIGFSALYGMELTSVTIPNGVKTIWDYAFANNSITSITIPSSVTYIGSDVFENNSITSITVDPNNTVYDSRDNSNAIIKTSDNAIYKGTRNTVIPNTVVSIWPGAFDNAGLTSINIPANVTDIWPGAFSNNPLTSITVDSNNSVYDSRNNSNAIIATADNELVQGSRNTVIPNTVVGIGERAFEKMGLTSITIPASVESIGILAFAHNPLTSITVDPNNTVYDSRNNSNAIIATADNALLQGSKNTIIPNTVVEIADCAFIGLGLTSITIPNSIVYIGEDAFADNQLTSITIPASVTVIDGFAFTDNSLTSVTFENPYGWGVQDNWGNTIILNDLFQYPQIVAKVINNNSNRRFQYYSEWDPNYESNDEPYNPGNNSGGAR